MGNTIDDSAGGPKPRPDLLQQVLAEMAEGGLDLRTPSQALDSADTNLQGGNYFRAQYDAYDAIGILESEGENKGDNLSLLERAYQLFVNIETTLPAKKLNPGEAIVYNGPIRIGDHLWVAKKDDWPPLAAQLLVSEVGYAILDLSSLTQVGGEYIGLKALRDGETIELAKIIGERISPESAEPNADIRLRREGDTIKVLSAEEVSAAVKKLLDSVMPNRIAIAKKALQTQLRGEVTEPERQQLLTDIAAIEAKLKETGDVPKE